MRIHRIEHDWRLEEWLTVGPTFPNASASLRSSKHKKLAEQNTLLADLALGRGRRIMALGRRSVRRRSPRQLSRARHAASSRMISNAATATLRRRRPAVGARRSS